MTHDDVADVARFEGQADSDRGFVPHHVLALAARQIRLYRRPDPAYTFNLQPFFADKNMRSRPIRRRSRTRRSSRTQKVKFFLLADGGYPPYGSTIVTTEKMIADKPDVVARFVKASLEGWRDYIKNPAPGNALIKADNPEDDRRRRSPSPSRS